MDVAQTSGDFVKEVINELNMFLGLPLINSATVPMIASGDYSSPHATSVLRLGLELTCREMCHERGTREFPAQLQHLLHACDSVRGPAETSRLILYIAQKTGYKDCLAPADVWVKSDERLSRLFRVCGAFLKFTLMYGEVAKLMGRASEPERAA